MSVSVNLLQQLNTISNPSGTGIPVTTYVTEMQSALTAELTKAPDNELSQLSSSQTALTALQTALQSFQTATQTLASSQQWNSVTATSSDTSAFTVTTAPGAQPSTYSLQVTSLATNQIDIQNLSSQYQTTESGSSNLNAGSLIITPNTANSGNPVTVSVTAGESLNSVVSAINQDSSTTGVQASVINNGQGQYMLAMSSIQTGTSNGFSLSGTLIGSGTGQIQMATTSATNASINLDGQTLTSSTNTFTNSIPNVTIQVSQTMSTAGTMTLSTSTDSVVQAVQTWMDSYNKVIDLLHTDTAYTPPASGTSSTTTGTAGPLFNDVNANALLGQLPAQLNQMFTTANSAISSLASVGIVLDPQSGHLEFQSSSGYSFSGGASFSGSLQDGKTMFENAMSSDPNSVEQLFGVIQDNSLSTALPTSGVLGGVNTTLQTFLFGSNGQLSPIQSDLKAITAQQTSVNSYLDLINKQIQNQVADYTNQLNALNAAMEQAQLQSQKMSAMFSSSSSSSSSTVL